MVASAQLVCNFGFAKYVIGTSLFPIKLVLVQAVAEGVVLTVIGPVFHHPRAVFKLLPFVVTLQT
ncbi:hypothetical protein D3C71_1935270 [compost metagenome]